MEKSITEAESPGRVRNANLPSASNHPPPGATPLVAQTSPKDPQQSAAGENLPPTEPVSAPAPAPVAGWRWLERLIHSRDRLENHLAWVVAGWLLGVCLLSMRLLVGWIAIERLKRVGVEPAREEFQVMQDQLAHRLRISRPVRLVESALAEVPTLIGWLKPVVLLPVRACTGLSTEQIETILAHELAHVQRWDYLMNVIQVLIETLLFYHPVVWWLSGTIRKEREQCCDDVVVALCGDRFLYARALTAMEELRGRSPQLAMAAGTKGSLLRMRILRLLGVPREPDTSAARWLAGVFALGALVAVAMGIGIELSVTAAGATAQDPLLALSREQIPAYELKAASPGDPASLSPSLVAILGDSRLKMLGYVTGLVYTPDGQSLISSGNREIAFWDPRTGEQKRVLRGHTDQVDALAISRDGRTLVSGGYDRVVKIWDLPSGKERFTLAGHLNLVDSVAISPDGKQIASGEYAKVRLWDAATGRLLKQLTGHDRGLWALAFSPDGGTLASGGEDGKILVWDVAKGRVIDTLERSQPDRWRALAFSPDGMTLAAAGFDHGLVLWDVPTWKVRQSLPEEDRMGAYALAFTHDGRRLAVSLGRNAKLVDVGTGKVLRTYQDETGSINALAFSPDDATLAANGLMIRLWDVATGEERTPQPLYDQFQTMM
jgi:beta-lactamase regulating signal transducer with metallopeptidase domain